jgi:predicted transposase/invertase (TIGR01784 family)
MSGVKNKLLLPKYDITFKSIFKDERNRDIVEDFLKAVLEIPKEESLGVIRVRDSELLPQSEADKVSILDVLIDLPNDEKINVEMQLCRLPEMKERLMHYWAKIASNQLSSGESYDKFRKVISILITEFSIVSDSENYLHHYELYDKKDGSKFTDLMQYVIIELPKLPKSPDGTEAWLWGKFLSSNTEEEMSEVAKNNEHIDKAKLILVKMSADEQAQYQAEREEMQRRDYVSRMNGARKVGIELGIERGERINAIENSRRMKADGMDASLISKYTGLSIEEIEVL